MLMQMIEEIAKIKGLKIDKKIKKQDGQAQRKSIMKNNLKKVKRKAEKHLGSFPKLKKQNFYQKRKLRNQRKEDNVANHR